MAMRHLMVVLVALTAVLDGGAGNCGMPHNHPNLSDYNRVVRGGDAKPHSWPWMVLLKKKGQPYCGGSLISDRWVLTAAHCKPKKDVEIKAVLGEHDRNAREGSERVVEVVKEVVHPQWDPSTLQNDIALFKLKTPVDFRKEISPVCLPTGTPTAGTDCYLTGWGSIRSPTGGMHSYLQQAKIPLVSNHDCREYNHKSIQIRVTSDMLCAGDAGKSRKTVCNGDDGGPLVCQEKDGSWMQVGVVSWGSAKCASNQIYSVFARVFKFRQWIEDTMANNSD